MPPTGVIRGGSYGAGGVAYHPPGSTGVSTGGQAAANEAANRAAELQRQQQMAAETAAQQAASRAQSAQWANYEAPTYASSSGSTPAQGTLAGDVGAPGGSMLGGTPAMAPPTAAPNETAAMMSMGGEGDGDFPQPMMPIEGPMLRQLGRRMYPQESTALASMGRVY